MYDVVDITLVSHCGSDHVKTAYEIVPLIDCYRSGS